MINKILSENQIEALRLLVDTFNKNRIRFQVSGGLAAIAYGAKRPLYDIDIDINKEDIERVREIFRRYIVKDFYHLQEEGFDIWLITLKINGVQIDITQAQDSYFNGVRANPDISKAERMSIEGINVPVEPKQSLIAYKQILGRDTDLLDIQQILGKN